jgi:hypothetical protein
VLTEDEVRALIDALRRGTGTGEAVV